MDLQMFSERYWYIWLLLVLLIVILFMLNGVGIILYRKRRREFLRQSNDDVYLNEIASLSNENINKPRPQRVSILSTIVKRPLTTITETLENSQIGSISYLCQTNDLSEIDLAIEEFQREALKEHNSIRFIHNKPPLKLSDSLNIFAQYWAEHCAKTDQVIPSKSEWRLQCKGQPISENIVSIKSSNTFDGARFTSLIMANGEHSREVKCLLNEISTEVGFGRAQRLSNNDIKQDQWIAVAHYYPFHQLTSVQS